MNSIFFHTNPETAAAAGGNLQGLKIAIQPNISVTGWPTEAGSKALANFRAIEDASIAGRLIQAGALLCGSTRMSEFGFGLDGGSAGEALKQKAADAELVIDLMGESRVAASRANACGFKPSYGLVSRLGLVGLIPSMECCGIISADMNNIRNILKAVAGRDDLDFSMPDETMPDFSCRDIDPKETTIGAIAESRDSLSAEQQVRFSSSIDELKTAGFKIMELSLPDFSLFELVHKIVGSVEASSCAGRYDSVRYGERAPGAKNWNEMYLSSRGAAFGTLLKSYLFLGAYLQFQRYKEFEDACRIRARLLKGVEKLMSQADFLVFPAESASPAGDPASLAGTYAQFSSTLFANVTGQPALYLPPPGPAQSGIQFAGPRLSDARLLALGDSLLNLRKGGK